MSNYKTVTRAEFLRDPAVVSRMAEAEPVVILDEDGNPGAIVSCPRDERPDPYAPSLNAYRDEALRVAVEHGFTDATVLEDMALIVTEVAELIEDYRAGREPTVMHYETRTPLDKPCGIPSECADIFIRLMHFCGKHGIDIHQAVREKMVFNASRPFKHGKRI